MEDLNIYGWSALHEACYKGYINAVIRFLEYAKTSEKNLIELKTDDDFKATPILVASLGGHMDIIELLYNNGANINETLYYNDTVKHGIIEVAAIRQHIDLLVYLFDKIPDMPKRLRVLMTSEVLDRESRASVGRTIEILSSDYPNMISKLSKFKPETHASRSIILFKGKQMIAYKTIQEDEFGACLATFLKLSESNEESIASAILILINIINNDRLRASFIENKGIYYLIYFMQKHKKRLNKSFTNLCNKLIRVKMHTDSDDENEKEPIKIQINEALDDLDFVLSSNDDEEQDNFIECSSIGQALGALSKFDEFHDYVNREDANEKIIKYIKSLFEFNIVKKLYDVNTKKPIVPELSDDDEDYGQRIVVREILFEHYIGSYIVCLGNMTSDFYHNKAMFGQNELFELIMGLWKFIETISFNMKHKFDESFFANYNFLKKLKINHLFDLESDYVNMQSVKGNVDSERNLVVNKGNKNIGPFSQDLIKNLKLAIIECLGKCLHTNFDLKKKYCYSYMEASEEVNFIEFVRDRAEWPNVFNVFLKTLISYLDSTVCYDKDVQMGVLKFLKYLVLGDIEMQGRIIETKKANDSALITSFRNLLRKSSPFYLRKQSLLALWALNGDENFQDNHDRKCTLYKAIGGQKFVDMLFDSDDEVSMICLEALQSIANGPPYRDSTNQLIKILHDASKIQAIPAILRLFKTKSSQLISACLNTISALCVSSIYTTSDKNQMLLIRQTGLPIILETCMKNDSSIRQKCEGFYCLSMICFKNTNVARDLFNLIDIELLIKHVYVLLTKKHNEITLMIKELNTDEKNKIIRSSVEEKREEEQIIDIIDYKLMVGLTICAFSFQNEDFMKSFITICGRINWNVVYNDIMEILDKKLKESVSEKKKHLYFSIQRLRCLFGFQVAALFNLIEHAREDLRAVGMKILCDTISYSSNTYLRSIACDYIGRLIKFNPSLIESLICINTVEILADAIVGGPKGDERGEAEVGNAAISLWLLTNQNPEARRRFLREARRNQSLMQQLKYINEVMHIDLVNEWKHFKELNDLISSNICRKSNKFQNHLEHEQTPRRRMKHHNKLKDISVNQMGNILV